MQTTILDKYSLRHVTMDDLPGYFQLIENNRKRLETFFAGTVAITKDLEATKAHLEDILAKHEMNNYFSFVVEDNSTQKLIGSIQIKNMDWNIPKAEIGYYIDGAYEGKGITSAAVAKVIEYGFEKLNLAKLYLRANHANKGSVKVAEKNGFEIEGILRKDYRTTDGTLVDLIYYGLLNPAQAEI